MSTNETEEVTTITIANVTSELNHDATSPAVPLSVVPHADPSACYDVPQWHYIQHEETAPTVNKTGDQKVPGFSSIYKPELFHRLYSEVPSEVPAASRGRGARLREKLHTMTSELLEFETLRKDTLRDAFSAGIACELISDMISVALPYRPELKDPIHTERTIKGLEQLKADGMNVGEELKDQKAKLEEIYSQIEVSAEALDESKIRNALRTGIEKSHEELDLARDAANGFSLDPSNNSKEAYELFKRVKNSSKLKKIIQMAGRLKNLAKNKRATKTEYQRSEVVGVEQTGDISNLLPSEFIGIDNPLRLADLARRLTERNALGYKLHAKAKLAQGPILVLLDDSGSMQGANDVWSKAIALALMDISIQENRAFGLTLFNDRLGAGFNTLTPKDFDRKLLISICEHNPDGGTNFTPPMQWALTKMKQASSFMSFKTADVIIITDGEADTMNAKDIRREFEKLGANVYGIAIGTYSTRALEQWCHSVEKIDDVSNDAKATDLLFENL